MGELLSVKNINVYYGSIHAIKDVSFHVDEGEIVTLIGANGAGKTTTMHAISGLLKLASGEITYDGNLISKMEAHKIVRLGLAQVPEGRRVFSGLTVQQNLSMGAYTRHDGKDAIQSDYDMVFDLLPRLKERRNQPAGTLSGGEQQMLAVGRALMCKPKILLLDEPSMGLSPLLVKEIFKIIRDINRQGVTVLLVEQNAKMALDIAKTIGFESNDEYNEIMFLREITHTINAFNEMADIVRLYSKKPKTAEQRLANLLSEVLYEDSESV